MAQRLLPPPVVPRLGRASSQQPSTGAKLPIPELRRIRSAPTERLEAAAKQRFTDLALKRLTSATAPPVATSEQPKEVPICFGDDPPPRKTAASAPGQCAVCFDDKAETFQLCWNTKCDQRYCSECISGFSAVAVDDALYAVPWLRCPGCKSRISTDSWANHAEEPRTKYTSNAEALLTFRCADCHEVGSLLQGHGDKGDLANIIADDIARKLQELWSDYCYAVSSPETLLDAMKGLDDSQREKVMSRIVDLERRTCLQLAQLRRDPFIHTPCCDSEFCFKCKVASHHEGETCEERQRGELEISCQFCPDCEVPTVRTEGCDHIVCVCGSEWTWQEVPEQGQALGPARYLREALAAGSLDANWMDEDGRTLLMTTAGEGRRENMEILIEFGADVDARDVSNNSVMLHAFGVERSSYTEECVDLLVEKNAVITEQDLHRALRSPSGNNMSAMERIMLLTSVGVDHEVTEGKSLIQEAIHYGKATMVNYLMDKHARVDRLAPFWFITATVFVMDLSLFSKLLSASGLDVDEPAFAGRTLLQTAVKHQREALVRNLITDKKAKATWRDVVRSDVRWQNQQVLAPLVFSEMIAQGVDVWAPGPDGSDESRGFLLWEAVTRGPWAHLHKRYTKELVDKIMSKWNEGADLYARTKQGAALVAKAAMELQWAVVHKFVQAGAGADARESAGKTALHFAVAAKHQDITALLVEARVDLLCMDQDGATPVRLAEEANWEIGLQMLRKAVAEAAERAALSGDGTVDNVGIRLDGRVQCPDCNQKFDTQRATEIHWKFIHDPNRHQED